MPALCGLRRGCEWRGPACRGAGGSGDALSQRPGGPARKTRLYCAALGIRHRRHPSSAWILLHRVVSLRGLAAAALLLAIKRKLPGGCGGVNTQSELPRAPKKESASRLMKVKAQRRMGRQTGDRGSRWAGIRNTTARRRAGLKPPGESRLAAGITFERGWHASGRWPGRPRSLPVGPTRTRAWRARHAATGWPDLCAPAGARTGARPLREYSGAPAGSARPGRCAPHCGAP